MRPPEVRMTEPWIRPFRALGLADVPLVGGKNASLGEMVRTLGPLGVKVPDGFATTAAAYRHFLDANGLVPRVRALLAGLDLDDVADLQRRGHAVRQALLAATVPADLDAQILTAYEDLSDGAPGGTDVAVRSSATAEDLPDASFAGQQETFLNVRGAEALRLAVRRCFASLFTDRAISYRTERGYDHLQVALSVGVQRMVRADKASSGVIFTLDTESGARNVVVITGAWGLGENVVQGAVVPDEWVVHKPTLAQGHRPIVRRTLGSKEMRMVYDEGGGRLTRNVPVAPADRARFVLSDDEVLELARQAVAVETHYGRLRGTPTPMDLEWAKDGRTGELFVVQARPETVRSRESATSVETFTLGAEGRKLVTGTAVGQRIGAGTVRVVRDPKELATFRDGDVLVAERTDPDWEPVMRRAAAIVTDHGGRTCHAAIVSRELGVPAVVGCGDATARLADGRDVTVSCAAGADGAVYEGRLPFTVARADLSALPRPVTKVMMNVGNPAEAFRLARIPCDGVGLAREEFIVTSTIGIHPLALLRYDTLDAATKAAVDARTGPVADRPAFYVDRLAEGVATIAAAFWPRDVIVRLSDFKTNEYAGLVGGAPFEPAEENPMLGFRGASRYVHPAYRDAFALECAALRRVRDDMGLVNVKLMVPFCRTPAEGRAVIAELARHGLVQHERGLEVYVMCEIPSNVILVDRFAEVFDGFSIGSNDLTQLVLGVDRDSETVAPLFDERDDAVKWAVRRAIEGARAAGRKIGICGQAPSDHPDFARFLVDCGIDSVSLNPDAVLRVTQIVAEAERGRAAVT
jgi:pyruvate,water dikinase